MTVPSIPVLLLKTRSQPDDTYEECFASKATRASAAGAFEEALPFDFAPHFIPVLEHTHNTSTLAGLENQLRYAELKRKYGGMIFTSQRAVEAWAAAVYNVQQDQRTLHGAVRGDSRNTSSDPFADLELLTPFPLYVVGPATERALQILASGGRTKKPGQTSVYAKLNTSIHGAQTGNGAALASFILEHYNQQHREHWFEYFEAPRLPFIPLLGMSSQNYGRKRLEKDDDRLKKKPLLFLVGEVRRDIIPKTLQDQVSQARQIQVDEIEVYRTEVMKSFEDDFAGLVDELDYSQKNGTRVIVVFSPQGSDIMLKRIGYLDNQGQQTERATHRWWQRRSTVKEGGWIVVTIGPTTRDYLKDELGIEPDICSRKPNPESLRACIEAFLKEKIPP